MNKSCVPLALLAVLGCSSQPTPPAKEPLPELISTTPPSSLEVGFKEKSRDPEGYFVRAVRSGKSVEELIPLVPARGLNPPPQGDQMLLIEAVKANNFELAEFLARSSYPVFFVDPETTYSALHFAAKNGNLKMVEMLVDCEADVNHKTNGRGYVKPLQLAQQSGNQQVVKFLEERGAR